MIKLTINVEKVGEIIDVFVDSEYFVTKKRTVSSDYYSFIFVDCKGFVKNVNNC